MENNSPSSNDNLKAGTKDNENEDMFESSAFEALEKEFQEVLQELVGDKSLEHFRLEYEKLYRTLKKSHESEKRLIKKCRELNSEIVSNAARVQTALRLSTEDQATIASLQREIERAWKMVDASQEKEQRARETVTTLKSEISSLSKLVELGANLSVNQENTLNDLLQQKEELTKEKETLTLSVTQLTTVNKNLYERITGLENDKFQSSNVVTELQEALHAKKLESEREIRRKERLDKELKSLRQSLDDANTELENLKSTLTVEIEKKNHADASLKEMIKNNEVSEKLNSDLKVRIADSELKYNQETAKCSRLEGSLSMKNDQLKEKEVELSGVVNERVKLEHLYDALKVKNQAIEKSKLAVENEKATMISELQSLSREIDSLKRHSDADKKITEDLVRERDALNQALQTAERTAREGVNHVLEEVKKGQALSAKIAMLKSEAIKYEAEKAQLEKERDKFSASISAAHSKYLNLVNELKNKDMVVSDLKRELLDSKNKLAQQKTLYESIRTDRNIFSKNLSDSHDEMVELKTKFKLLYNQINQLKDDIKEQEKVLLHEHFTLNKKSKENIALKESVEKLKLKTATLEKNNLLQVGEIKKLSSIISSIETQKNIHKKEYSTILSERDILGLQLVRKNDESLLLYEKVKVLENTLARGNVLYNEKISELTNMKKLLSKASNELHVEKSKSTRIEELKKELYALQKNLLKEKLKVKALSNELETPLNIHHWRLIDSVDSSSINMIKRVNVLQKKLLKKNNEIIEKDIQLKEKEKLYIELKSIMDKNPSPDTYIHIETLKNNIQEKNKQLKALASELNIYQTQIMENKNENQRLQQIIIQLKKKYFQMRKMNVIPGGNQNSNGKGDKERQKHTALSINGSTIDNLNNDFEYEMDDEAVNNEIVV